MLTTLPRAHTHTVPFFTLFRRKQTKKQQSSEPTPGPAATSAPAFADGEEGAPMSDVHAAASEKEAVAQPPLQRHVKASTEQVRAVISDAQVYSATIHSW